MASDFKVNGITPLVGNIKVGTNNVSKIYQGPTQVWPTQVVNPVSDLSFLPFQNATLFLEMAQAVWATQDLVNLQTGAPSVTGSSFTVPTTLDGSTVTDFCPSNPQYSADNYGNQFQTSQTQGAFFIEVNMNISSNQSGDGIAAGIVIQTRADSTQNWANATNMAGVVMSNSTNHGYHIQSASQPLGLYKSPSCPTAPGGFGGCGSLVSSNFLNSNMNASRIFCFDEVGEYRIIVGALKSTGGSCFSIQNNFNFSVDINIDTLYDGTNFGYPYNVSTTSSNSTTINAYAAEPYPMAVQRFYSDAGLTTPLSNSAGAKYIKRLNTSGGGNPTAFNFELTKNAEYELGIDSSGNVITQIIPNYN